MPRPAEMAPSADDLFLRNIDPTLSGEVENRVDERPRQYAAAGHNRPKPARPNAETRKAEPAPDLQAQNLELRKHLTQAVERLKDYERTEGQWRAREEDFDKLIEEKAEIIRHLHTQLQEAKIQSELAAPKELPAEEELQQLHDELLREREQLKLDEQELMEQMRNMEIQMSRERAELARQRNELQLLHRELQRELEMASRDASLQEKLAPLYKLQQELGRKSVAESGVRTRPKPAPEPTGAHEPTVADSAVAGTKETKIIRRSGFFRRMFNRDPE